MSQSREMDHTGEELSEFDVRDQEEKSISPPDQTENLQLEEHQPEEKEKRSKKFIYSMIGISAAVFMFAFVVIFFAFQSVDNQESASPANLEAGTTAGSVGELVETEDFLDGPIEVVHETEYITFNANTDGTGQLINPGAGAQLDPVVAEEVEELVFVSGSEVPESESAAALVNAADSAVSALTGSNEGDLGRNYANLLGIDVLESQAMARNAGYTVHQVFVVHPDTVNNGATPPPAGQVIDVQTYTMRGNGERYMFLHVMTTEPVGAARPVPNVVGVQWQTGRDRLRGQGLGPRYVYERNSADLKGRVLFQAPAPGSFTPRNSTVIMVLADN